MSEKPGSGPGQNLRDFTVQIRHTANEAIVGTGVAASLDGQIVTCAHVVSAAGVDPRAGDGAEVHVYFQHARSGQKARRATVEAYFDQHEDDIVLLQLKGGPPPLDPEQIAVLGTAAMSAGHEFTSYGYRQLHKYQGLPARGQIVDFADKPAGKVLHARPVMISSQHIDRGMSGAAVLDIQRNLVVGIIAETWDSGGALADRDTNFAIDARVLTFPPLKVPMHEGDYPLRPAPQPKTDIEAARAAVAADVGVELHDAPPPLTEWVGREELLGDVTDDWADPRRSVTGLIGFGGEGKSGLARRWLDELLDDQSQPDPDGVFWWDFYKRRNVDQFFEAALTYLSGGQMDPRRYPSANAKMHLIAGMLGGGRYIFVLDGLEVLQEQEGDRYGLLRNADLREFVEIFAAAGHESFCLITSRAPVLDLLGYNSYMHRDVDRLSVDEGRALLLNVGVNGSDEALDAVVQDWDGHALTLGLLGSLLADQHGGDVALIDEIPAPTADEPRYDRVHRVLRRYDEQLTDADKAFLRIFSAFRLPVEDDAFGSVFRADSGPDAINAPLTGLDNEAFYNIVGRLVDRRILRANASGGEVVYTVHPLIRDHYLALLAASDRNQIEAVHERIKDYYLARAAVPKNPTLDDLGPLIEAVHHACQAGDYDEARLIQRDLIYQGDIKVLIYQLGAYETVLELMREFFPEGDLSQEPQVSAPQIKGFIINEVGLAMMSLGRPGEAMSFLERAKTSAIDLENWVDTSRAYQLASDIQRFVGALNASTDAANEGLASARRANSQREETNTLGRLAVVAYLRGEMEVAAAEFREAEAIERELNPNVRYLYNGTGNFHADFLRRAGDPAYARRVAIANVQICEQQRWLDDLSGSHRVLGDLEGDAGEADAARRHYAEAIDIARGISRRDILIEALSAHGRWAARNGDPNDAFSDLEEVLGYAVSGSYRLFEADIRVGLGWAHHAAGDDPRARAEAERAQRMSAEMGYHWGQVDAAEILAALALA